MKKKTITKKINNTGIILFLLLITISVNAQVTQQWVQRFNGTGNNADYADKVVIDKFTGDIYVTGSSIGARGGYDIVTIKYNPAGVQQWIKSYNGTGNGTDDPADMVFDNLGNIIITGSSAGLNSMQDIITIKYDKNGNRQWVKRYNGTANGNDFGWALSADVQGGITITGQSFGTNTLEDIITIKYSNNGTEEWVQRYNDIDNMQDAAYSIISDNNANVYIAGYSGSINNSGDFITIKYNPQGSVEWVKKLTNHNNEIAYKILTNYQTGYLYSIGKSESNTIMVCYDYSGNEKWQTSDYGAISGFSAAAIDNSGNIFICGNTTVNGTSDYAVIAYNSSGGLAWFNTYNGAGSGYDYPKAITIDNSDNIYITGYSQGAGSGYDYTTLKYSQTGTQLWERRYNFSGTGSNIGSSVAIDNGGNLYVTGYSQNISGNYDYATIKYTQGLIFSKGVNELPADYRLHQNYPNPFNPSTTIKFDIPRDGIVKIAVYDMPGREVQVLADEFKDAGSYEVNFDASHLSSGTYLCKLTAGSYTDIKKMILVK